MLFADVPITPDAETARQWAEQELGKPEYHRDISLLDRLLQWLGDALADFLNGLGGGGGGVGSTSLITVLIFAALIGFAWWIIGPLRRSRRGEANEVTLHDDPRTAAEMRASAAAAARSGLWSLATMDQFRAIVRSLEERVVIDESAGRTALEATRAAASALPSLREELSLSSSVFDDACYGHAESTEDQYLAMKSLDDRALALRPQHAGVS